VLTACLQSGNNRTIIGKHTRFEESPTQIATTQRFTHLDKKRKGDQSDAVDGNSAKLPLVKKKQKESPLDAEAGEVAGPREDATIRGALGVLPAGLIDATSQVPRKADKQQRGEKGHKSRKIPKASNEIFQKLLNKPKKGS